MSAGPNHWLVKACAAAAVLVICGIVGEMDYADAVRERIHYCDMVAAGAWPDRTDAPCFPAQPAEGQSESKVNPHRQGSGAHETDPLPLGGRLDRQDLTNTTSWPGTRAPHGIASTETQPGRLISQRENHE